jgi:hypothetical protein
VTTAPAAKAALIAAIQTRQAANPSGALQGVTARWASPTKVEEVQTSPAGLIYLGRVKGKQKWAALGRLAKDEDYSIALTVQVYQEGDDPQGTEQAAWAIFAEVEQALRADPTLGNVLNRQAEIEEQESDSTPIEPQAWAVKVTAQVRCHARI